MADFLKIIQAVGAGVGVLNRVQDNVSAAQPARSDITDGFLVENASYPGSVNHGLGRQAIGAFVVSQTGGADPVVVTGLSATEVQLDSAGSGSATLWVF